MTDNNSKKWDLSERMFIFAKNVRQFLKCIPKNVANHEDSRQLIRSSGSIAANYLEANDGLGKVDVFMRMKISRKEAKETILWLRLLDIYDTDLEEKRANLAQEANKLKNILSAIIQKKS